MVDDVGEDLLARQKDLVLPGVVFEPVEDGIAQAFELARLGAELRLDAVGIVEGIDGDVVGKLRARKALDRLGDGGDDAFRAQRAFPALLHGVEEAVVAERFALCIARFHRAVRIGDEAAAGLEDEVFFGEFGRFVKPERAAGLHAEKGALLAHEDGRMRARVHIAQLPRARHEDGEKARQRKRIGVVVQKRAVEAQNGIPQRIRAVRGVAEEFFDAGGKTRRGKARAPDIRRHEAEGAAAQIEAVEKVRGDEGRALRPARAAEIELHAWKRRRRKGGFHIAGDALLRLPARVEGDGVFAALHRLVDRLCKFFDGAVDGRPFAADLRVLCLRRGPFDGARRTGDGGADAVEIQSERHAVHDEEHHKRGDDLPQDAAERRNVVARALGQEDEIAHDAVDGADDQKADKQQR